MSTGDPILVALQKLEANLFEKVRAEVGRQIDGLRLEMNARFDAIEVRLERLGLKTRVSEVQQRIHDIEARLDEE